MLRAHASGGLSWRDLRVTLHTKRAPRTILDGACGEAEPGRVLAILGPSGSGKTTLLQLLAGRLETSRKIGVGGALSPAPSQAAPAAFVYQEDAFHSRLTVLEVLAHV